MNVACWLLAKRNWIDLRLRTGVQWAVVLCALSVSTNLQAQEEIDTVRELNEVVVTGYKYNRPLSQVPLALGFIDSTAFYRFNASSLLPIINTLPGVRMEERSPGSYRFSIRGSTLRSPFGVRNVKVYLDGLPFTDPGGNTYLNLIDLSLVGSLEIMKGPAGSMYGAGTGGAILMESPQTTAGKREIALSGTAGSYGLRMFGARYSSGSAQSQWRVSYNRLQGDGYREQSAMHRDVLHASGTYALNKRSTIHTHLLLADLYYETPGGLTRAQYDTLPTQARPPTATIPGAVEQRAAVTNKTLYAGLSNSYEWNNHCSSQTGVYATYTRFENASIRNYERKTEQSMGLRSTTTWSFDNGKIDFGAEFQTGFSPVNVYDNNAGQTGSVQNLDEIRSSGVFAFAQADLKFHGGYFLTLGGSLNFYSVDYTQLTALPPFSQSSSFTPELSPRIALIKEFERGFSVYTSWSHGFSPPTVAELFPSTSSFNSSLNAEKGLNYELGIRTRADKRYYFDLSAYSFHMTDAIVVRRDDSGADYFVNAGGAVQNGVECYAAWQSVHARARAFQYKLWSSLTLNDYTFKDYVQGANDYSDNPVTGVPPVIWIAGLDLSVSNVYFHATFTFNDELTLNDAATEYADAYSLLSIRFGWQKQVTSGFILDVFAGGDNLLDEKYSLGNDLNAFGGRYFNAAPLRSLYIGAILKLQSL